MSTSQETCASPAVPGRTLGQSAPVEFTVSQRPTKSMETSSLNVFRNWLHLFGPSESFVLLSLSKVLVSDLCDMKERQATLYLFL
jgi:hypothetical protein